MKFGNNKKAEQQQEQTVHPKDVEKLHNMPYIEFKYSKSKDKKYVIVKTIFTDIKPITYWEKVFSDDAE